MITHVQDENGNWRELTGQEKIDVNQRHMGLSPSQQREIEAIESGRSSGDVIIDDDSEGDVTAEGGN